MLQICKRTPMPKFDFDKVAKQVYQYVIFWEKKATKRSLPNHLQRISGNHLLEFPCRVYISDILIAKIYDLYLKLMAPREDTLEYVFSSSFVENFFKK